MSVAASAGKKSLRFTQNRFFYLPPAKPEAQLWHVPIIVRAKTDKGISTHRLLLTEGSAELELPGTLEWALVNEDSSGFFRVRYAPELLRSLTANLGQLRAIERFALVSDTWASTVAGLTPLSRICRDGAAVS